MGKLLLLDIFQWFAVLIGLTSYRLVDGRLMQTRLNRVYTMILNVITVVMLPPALLGAAKFFIVDFWLPKFMWITPYVLYAVNYLVIVQTLTSRGHRDSILMELHHLIVKLNREMGRAGKRMNSKLRRLFYIKTFTMSCLCLSYVLGTFAFTGGFSFYMILSSVLINNGYCILIGTTHLYFVSLWQVVRGYDYVNQQLEELISTRSPLTSGYTEELRSLWSLHANLSRTAQKINRIYGRQMLASRFDYIVVTVINGYIGSIYSHNEPNLTKWYGGLLYWIRIMDFFMTDYICDLVTQCQSMRKDTVSEGVMSNELNSFLIYQNSMNLNLKVCGLYPANRKQWLSMSGAILCNSIMLLQYHLMMKAKTEKLNE
ncbi:putative gustatory receptor 59b [Drosophila guanche]|uniref:Gustatory receptor n=1 Tax=Drosophila guanche TaxID=7266 RepID=A0A3B0J2W5_DROGU|nr:putative gustatory receptor 59b [Drosophila guanche]SPP73532.1 blast:Putative gustatory receptor 59b [Drosophila guanche]